MVAFATLAFPGIAGAFDPPVDRQGPLTVQIDGPTRITDDGSFSVSIHLRSAAPRVVRGTVRLSGIDAWSCRPNDAVPFSVEADSESTLQFQVTPGPTTYAALYPLHARAQFDWQGEHLVAHPILVVDAAVSTPRPEAPALPWRPLLIDQDRTLSLWQMPVHRSVTQVFGHEPVTTAGGWLGRIQSHGASIDVRDVADLNDSSRSAIAIHPPWVDGQVGTAMMEYPLTLPPDRRITLRLATAVTASGSGDGVTFRVRAVDDDAPAGQSGDVVFERHSSSKVWEDGIADLSKWAGRTIRLQFESHPGPNNNTSYDQSYWAEPTLMVGSPPPANAFPPPRDADDSPDAIIFPCGDSIVDIRLGPRGLLDASIGLKRQDLGRLWFRGFEIRVDGVQLQDPGAPVTLKSIQSETIEDGIQVRHHFVSLRGEFKLVGTAVVRDETLQIGWKLADAPPVQSWQAPRIESVSTGRFSKTAHRVYAGHGNVIETPNAFRLGFDGHRLSTSFVGFDFASGCALLQAVDLPPIALEVDPEQRRYGLETSGNATFTFIPGSDVWQLCRKYRKVNGLRASGGVKKLAGRFVFDLWQGHYGASSRQLERAFRYGLTDAAVVWHNWQRWGYDYRLPEIYPPHTRGGTDAELRSMIDLCRRHGVLFALHDNYIDFYPDADGFSYSDVVAFDGRGRPVKAWLQESRQAQSYRYRADRVSPFLRDNVRLIHEQLDPTAYFIDVWSSIRPYDYWTADGRFFDSASTREAWGEHFDWIRTELGDQAPQISESGHDQLIGRLDGAQTNHLRVGNPQPGRYGWSIWDIECSDAERTPWFDAAHHDRFVLHGAGYSNRYRSGLDEQTHGVYSDDYIATEMLTGHPAMVSNPFGTDVVRKYWLTHDVLRALAMRTITSVDFVGDDLHRQHVRWSGDGQVWVNRGESPWTVGGVSLPTYGFLTRIPSERGMVSAAILRRDGLIVEQAQSPDSLYANARCSLGDRTRIRPQVDAVRQQDSRSLQIDLAWQVDEPIPTGFRPFLHFVDPQGEIVFQASFASLPWRDGETGRFKMTAAALLPGDRESDEAFELRVGMYTPSSGGDRLLLLGDDDDERRIRLGTLRLMRQGDASVRGDWTPRKPHDDPFLGRVNLAAKPVDFGWVVTAGGCRLTRHDGGEVRLVPLPQESDGTSWALRWDRLPWNLPRPHLVEARTESGEVLWQRPVGDSIVIEHDPAAFAYHLFPER